MLLLDIDYVQSEPTGGDLEGNPGSRARFQEQVGHDACARAAGRACGQFRGPAQQSGNVGLVEAPDVEQVARHGENSVRTAGRLAASHDSTIIAAATLSRLRASRRRACPSRLALANWASAIVLL